MRHGYDGAMKILVTTDMREAEELAEATKVGQPPKHVYEDLSREEAKLLEKKIGFPPMSSVELAKGTTSKNIQKITDTFRSNGLFVAIQNDDATTKAFPTPEDLPARNKLLAESLRRPTQAVPLPTDPAGLLLCFSNGTRDDVIRVAENTEEWRQSEIGKWMLRAHRGERV